MSNFWENLPKPFFALAPMEDATDTVFRQTITKAARPDVFFTEFVNAASYCSTKGQHSTRDRLTFTPQEQPLVVQIWGNNPEHFAKFAKDLKTMGFAGIDINMGCPVKDVVKTGSCSALIDNPSLAKELITATKEGGLPVSVKTRIGFKTKKTEEWTQFLLEQNIAALTMHGRTQKEMSKVPADWNEIAKVVEIKNQISPETIIIGNGDVEDYQDGVEKAKQTGVDGIMIGRGAFNNIFCFEPKKQQHTPKEYAELMLYHLDLYDKTWQNTQKPFAPLKRFFKIYIRDFPNASDIREELMQTTNTQEARAIIEKHFNFQ